MGVACGGSSDSTAPIANIAGTYTLESANGRALPSSITVPGFGTAPATAGTGTIGTGRSVTVDVNVGTHLVSAIPSVLVEESGSMVHAGHGYRFNIVDGTSATAICSSSPCTVTYIANTYVFVRG